MKAGIGKRGKRSDGNTRSYRSAAGRGRTGRSQSHDRVQIFMMVVRVATFVARLGCRACTHGGVIEMHEALGGRGERRRRGRVVDEPQALYSVGELRDFDENGLATTVGRRCSY